MKRTGTTEDEQAPGADASTAHLSDVESLRADLASVAREIARTLVEGSSDAESRLATLDEQALALRLTLQGQRAEPGEWVDEDEERGGVWSA